MAGGKWRNRLRRIRDRVFRRRDTPQAEASAPPTHATVPSEPGIPRQNQPGLPTDSQPPVIQISPNQPVYYYPRTLLRDGPLWHAHGQGTSDVRLPAPPPGLASPSPVRPFYSTRDSSRSTARTKRPDPQRPYPIQKQRDARPFAPRNQPSSGSQSPGGAQGGSSPVSSSFELSARSPSDYSPGHHTSHRGRAETSRSSTGSNPLTARNTQGMFSLAPSPAATPPSR